MKHIASVAALLVALSLLSFSQLGCQRAPDTNRSESTAANANSANEMVDTAAIESELLRIENDWPRVMREKDIIAVKSVEADDGIFIRPDGTIVTRADDIKDMESGAFSADSLEMADLKVKVLDKDAAVVSGITIINGGKYKLPDGKTIDISGQYRFIDTFARRDSKWQIVAGVSVKAPSSSATPSAKASPAASASPTAAASPAVRPSPVMRPSPVVRPSPAMRPSPATTRPPMVKTTPQ